MHNTLDRAAAPVSTGNAAAPAPRRDLYLGIHKALRLMYGDTLARIGSVDPGDAPALAAVLQQAADLFDLLEVHYADEDRFMHPALERVQPGCTTRIEAEHGQHRESIEQLRERVEVVRASTRATRDAALARLYQDLARTMAEDLEHMRFEDTEFNAILWRHYSDEQLAALHQELVASIEPAMLMLALHWMIPGLNAGERAALLAGARQGMPPRAFAAVLGTARRTLAPAEWAKLAHALGVPAA